MSSLVIAVCALLFPPMRAQTVVTLAGGSTSGATMGSTDGVGTAALFRDPYGVAVDSSGIVYIAHTSNNKINIIYPNLTVITLAGGGATGNSSGYIDGIGTAALFRNPVGAAVGASGVLYVVDQFNNKIRLISPNRTVITIAGGNITGNSSGSTDGVGTAALFASPRGIAVDTSGAVYVADQGNNKIRLIYPNRTVFTLAGGSTTGNANGNTNGDGTAALFNWPSGVALDNSGTLFVADYFNNKIRLIYPNRTVFTLAGGSTSGVLSGGINGVGSAALFSGPRGIAVDALGSVYVADTNNHKIRLIYPNRTVITLAGGSSSGVLFGSINGVGSAALFKSPRGVAVDASGAVYVTDTDNHKVRLIYPFSCSSGTFANFTTRSCIACLPGSFSNSSSAPSCSFCPGGTFAVPYGSTSCATCPAGHACPPGTSSWANLNCGRGYFCREGSATPIPCPTQVVPVPYASWAAHPMGSQGPAFLAETSTCLNHCFWNFTSGDGMLSTC
jgi:serine/threonine-protein kinase